MLWGLGGQLKSNFSWQGRQGGSKEKREFCMPRAGGGFAKKEIILECQESDQKIVIAKLPEKLKMCPRCICKENGNI